MEEKYLSAPVEFIFQDALDFFLVEKDDFGLNRNAVRRGRIDY